MDVKKVAQLANLTLTLEEEKEFTTQLEDILSYVTVLKKVNTQNIAATAKIGENENVFREDQSQASLPQKDYFRVKTLFPHEVE